LAAKHKVLTTTNSPPGSSGETRGDCARSNPLIPGKRGPHGGANKAVEAAVVLACSLEMSLAAACGQYKAQG